MKDLEATDVLRCVSEHNLTPPEAAAELQRQHEAQSPASAGTLGSVEADPLTPAEANGQDGDGARSGGDPFAEPPLAYLIAQYFRMVYADDQPASGPEGDDYGQAIDDLGEAIWAELQTKEYRALCDENERLRAEHERRDAVWDRVHWKHDDEVNALRDELEKALAWHSVAQSKEREAWMRLGEIKEAMRHISGRAYQYAHDARNAAHIEAAEGFYEIADSIDHLTKRAERK